MFIQGDLVKSKNRTDEYPLFLMVLHDRNQSDSQFNAVIIKDASRKHVECECGKIERECFCSEDSKNGYVSNSWNTVVFELCTWDEIKKFI